MPRAQRVMCTVDCLSNEICSTLLNEFIYFHRTSSSFGNRCIEMPSVWQLLLQLSLLLMPATPHFPPLFFFSSDSMLYIFLIWAVSTVWRHEELESTRNRGWWALGCAHSLVMQKWNMLLVFSANRCWFHVLYIRYDAKPLKKFSLQWHFKEIILTDSR